MFQDFLSVCKNLPEAEVQIWYNMDLNSEYSLQNYYKIKFSRISLLSCSVHDKRGLMGINRDFLFEYHRAIVLSC